MQKSLKAIVATLATLIAPFLVPWLASLTPDVLVTWFGEQGVTVGYSVAAILVSLAGGLATWWARNAK